LLQAQGCHDLPYGALLQRQIVQDVSPAGFGDGIKGIRSCGGTRHGCNNTFPYRHMSNGFFTPETESARTLSMTRQALEILKLSVVRL
jgi:hypothetical protein